MTKITPAHQPVLLETVLKYALPENGKTFVDGTFGLGGHSRAVLEKFTTLEQLIGIDRDGEILEYSKKSLDNSKILRFQATASQLPEILQSTGLSGVDGILLDLGVSSYQLDNPDRGFSFSKPGPLDMRMDQEYGISAEELVNSTDRDELIRIFREYGEEKFSGRIAEAIVRQRQIAPITATDQLAKIICDVVPGKSRSKSHIHPATRVFQAIRIVVNKELEELETFLSIALSCLNPGGHLSIISFHSLEDRLVKNFMQTMQKGCDCPPKFPLCICGKKPLVEILTRKAIFAEEEEAEMNPRARSARLRCARKLEDHGDQR